MSKTKKNWEQWLPSRPFKPEETIRDWDALNIGWDDPTICVLCGQSSACNCYDEYMCPCKRKNKDCKWPESVECPCRACEKKYFECVCDKPEGKTDEEWLEIKEILYQKKYNWDNEVPIDEELRKADEEDE